MWWTNAIKIFDIYRWPAGVRPERPVPVSGMWHHIKYKNDTAIVGPSQYLASELAEQSDEENGGSQYPNTAKLLILYF